MLRLSRWRYFAVFSRVKSFALCVTSFALRCVLRLAAYALRLSYSVLRFSILLSVVDRHADPLWINRGSTPGSTFGSRRGSRQNSLAKNVDPGVDRQLFSRIDIWIPTRIPNEVTGSQVEPDVDPDMFCLDRHVDPGVDFKEKHSDQRKSWLTIGTPPQPP